MGNRKSKSTELNFIEEIERIKSKTGCTTDEIVNKYKEFMKLYPDGTISQREFINTYKQYYRGVKSIKAEEFSKCLFKAIDTDNNGTIDFSEYYFSLEWTKAENVMEKLRVLFRIFDLDGNGKIEKSELRKLINSLYRVVNFIDYDTSEEIINEIINKFDINNDNVISETEFTNGYLEHEELQEILDPHRLLQYKSQ